MNTPYPIDRFTLFLIPLFFINAFDVGNPCNRVSGSGGVKASALRVGLIALRGVRAGEALTAPYVALNQSVKERRRELVSCECPRCLLEADGDQSCGSNMLKVCLYTIRLQYIVYWFSRSGRGVLKYIVFASILFAA